MIYLRKLNTEKDISDEYLSWMNDKDIHQFTEQRHKKHSHKDIKQFILKKNKSNNEFLFGIFLNKDKHVGNIKLGPINSIHKYAVISYFIGIKNLHNKGLAASAIKKIIAIARKKGIKKLKAGVYEMNIASIKVLKKNGFHKEGLLKSEYIYKKKRIDCYIFGKSI
jgi:ribosomal-protein-alanine N-acetyltransferase|tara:strand:- start:378 stop:875 length:498 start_codon:yes stop_codon:yes gene_type:complete